MYTTLEFLKSNDACVPGFGRMIRFFGTKFDRFEKIPLHVVALVGGYTDAKWVLESALVIDKSEYLEFRARTLVPMLRLSLQDEEISADIRKAASQAKLPLAPSVRKQVTSKLDTLEQQLKHKLLTEFWHILGFDTQDYTYPSLNEVEDFLFFVSSLPESYTPRDLRVLIGKRPAEYISHVFKHYRKDFVLRDGSNDTGRKLLTNLTAGSDGTMIASILQPEGMLKFLSTTKYAARIGSDTKIVMLPNGRVSVTQEMDVESLDYLQLLRTCTDRSPNKYRDQDRIDEEIGNSYPEFRAVQVSSDDNSSHWEYQHVVETPAPAARISRRAVSSVSDDEDDEGLFE